MVVQETKPGTNRGSSCGHALLGSLQVREIRPRLPPKLRPGLRARLIMCGHALLGSLKAKGGDIFGAAHEIIEKRKPIRGQT